MKKGLTGGALAFAVFYTVFALIWRLLPVDGDFSAITVFVGEGCGAFAGICTLAYFRRRFSDAEAEGEVVTDDVVSAAERPSRGRIFLRGVTAGVICGIFLLFTGLLYGKYVYGSADVPTLPLPLMIAFLGVGVPFCEEIFFRGRLLGYLLESGVSPMGGVIAVSAAFALIHDFGAMPFAFASGAALSLCALTVNGERRFLPSFLAHGIYNTSLCIITALTA